MIRIRYAFAAALVFLTALGAAAAETPTLLEGATIIDGYSAHAPRVASILIEGGRIAKIDDAIAAPAGAIVIDLHGKWIIPGLIDAHVHLTEGKRSEIEKMLARALRGGITAVRDMGGDDRILIGLARDTRLGDIDGPDIVYSALMAGPSFFKDPRAVASALGAIAGETPWMRAVTPQTDLHAAMLEAKGIGATGIKIYANLPATEVARVTAAAHEAGFRVWSHATIFPATPIDAVRAGVDVISHTPLLAWAGVKSVPQTYDHRYDIDYAALDLHAPAFRTLFDEMVKRGTILDATNAVFEPREAGHTLPGAEARFRFATAATKMAHQLGIRVDAGTDSLFLPKQELPLLHHEIEILVADCGFSPAEAIESATRINAGVLGIAADAGTIEQGKRANLVVLNADPLLDIRNTTAIDRVIKDGRIYEASKTPPSAH